MLEEGKLVITDNALEKMTVDIKERLGLNKNCFVQIKCLSKDSGRLENKTLRITDLKCKDLADPLYMPEENFDEIMDLTAQIKPRDSIKARATTTSQPARKRQTMAPVTKGLSYRLISPPGSSGAKFR